MKFKVGDRVKVIGKIIPQKWGNTWVSEMNEFIGKEYILSLIHI